MRQLTPPPSPAERCGNCVHWGKPYEYYDGEEFEDRVVPQFKMCEQIVHIGKHIDNPHSQQIANLPNTISAFTLDASGYKADLWTREDFHCALWAAKT